MSTPATPSPEATPGQQPPANPQVPPPAAPQKKVEVDEETLAQLQRDAARAQSAQSDLDRFKRQQQRRKTVSEPEPFTADEKASIVSGVSQLVLSKPEYGKLVQENPALRKVLFGRNPLTLLDVDDFVDIQDAIDQLENYLAAEVTRVGNGGTVTPPETTPPAPTPSPLNPQTTVPPVRTETEKKTEELNKMPGMTGVEARLAHRIGVKP